MRYGICLEGKKEASLISWAIGRISLAERVRIPLTNSLRERVEPMIEIGEDVGLGQKIAVPASVDSVSVHASISGRITDIRDFPYPLGGMRTAIEITAHEENRREFYQPIEREDWNNLSREEILKICQELGLVDLVPEMHPLHKKILKVGEKSSFLIINACESEPYITTNHALLMSHPVEVLKGAEILRKTLGAERVLLALEDHQLEVAELIKSKIYFLRWKNYEVKLFRARYPQGNPSILASDILKAKFEGSGKFAEIEAPVFDAATLYALYEAVVYQKPLIERPVTIGGGCTVESRNVWLPIGASFQDVLRKCRGLLREPGKLLMGGPMRGFAQQSYEVPVLKGTQAILALPREVVKKGKEGPCIRCNRCVEACPVEISPVLVATASEFGDFDLARTYGAEQCIECGNCSYICPAKRPMLDWIRAAKQDAIILEEDFVDIHQNQEQDLLSGAKIR
ncbi:MAG: RnfABCDGE type electron transport complex subunit C [Candidatus Omnitrophica bacterium]|nr:RnfABCDGE type electron transport complex subunit C [Candidatus Omnitrophota bacterium]